MRTILFLDNWAGWRVAQWLGYRGEESIALVLHPESDSHFRDDILVATRLITPRIFTADQLHDPQILAQLRELRPDLGICASFGHILKPELIDIFPRGIINLHPAFLPNNRGTHSHVWPIIDGSPAGATIHYIDPGISTGDIISQRRFPVDLTETGASLHEKITRGLVELFKDTWPQLKAGTSTRTPQDHSKATHHTTDDLAAISEIHLDRKFRAGDLLNRLRALTFPPFPGAYISQEGIRTYLRVNFTQEHTPRPQRNELATRFELNTQYTAREFLEILTSLSQALAYPAFFEHSTGRTYVRATRISEIDIDPSVDPPWTQDHIPPA